MWLPLIICGALVAAWYHALRLRERAVAHARDLCKQHGLQLLDDSVGLRRLRLHRSRGRLRVVREYHFEISAGGNDRRGASITLVDGRIVRSSLPAPAAYPPASGATFEARRGGASAAPPIASVADTNVVPITRARRTLN
ncbi:MAG TPA: DUF3301 domain-containing protein [Rhodanobacteraceae bacterium]